MIVVAHSERHWPRPFIVMQRTLMKGWIVLGREETREKAEEFALLCKTTPTKLKNLSDFL